MSKFESGSLSLSVYRVDPFPSSAYSEELPEMLSNKPLPPQIGTTPVRGWSSRYPGDTEFDASDMMVTDSIIKFMHVEACVKPPASAVEAMTQKMKIVHMEENGLSMLSRRRQNEIKAEAEQILSQDTPPSYSHTDMIYAAEDGYLLIASTSPKQCDNIVALFMETFGVNVYPVSVGNMCPTYTLNDHEPLDLRGDDAGAELEDNTMIMARDFLTWLWYVNEMQGNVTLQVFDDIRTVDIGFDGPLQFVHDAAAGALNVKVDKGLPTLSGEAQKALVSGKKLQKAKVSLVLGDDIYAFTFNADLTVYSGLKLPDGESMDKMERVGERVDMILDLNEIMTQLVNMFAQFACDYPSRQEMHEWANTRVHHN